MNGEENINEILTSTVSCEMERDEQIKKWNI